MLFEYENNKDCLWRKSLLSGNYFFKTKIQVVEDLSSKIQTLWSWGSNKFGQLGHGTQIRKSMPKPINYLLGYINSNIIDVIKIKI